MAQYQNLKNAIEHAVVWDNGENKITGTILFNVLISLINSLGADHQFVDVAGPSTIPGTPDQRVFYIAGPGTYPNFGSTVVKAGEIGVFRYVAGWSYKTVPLINIINNLNGGVNDALSAEQGKVLRSEWVLTMGPE